MESHHGDVGGGACCGACDDGACVASMIYRPRRSVKTNGGACGGEIRFACRSPSDRRKLGFGLEEWFVFPSFSLATS